MSGLVRQGYREAREVTRRHARSFFFASALLFGARKRAAYALYAACRGLDDLVDDGRVADPAGRLAEASDVLARAMRGEPVRPADAHPWTPAQLAALSDAAGRFAIPGRPFAELVRGMEMDLSGLEYRTWAELDLYCYRVAGTVGELMAPVLGCRDDSALGAARDLGKAMQLTNILRDVREDYERGRVYLPSEELRAFGVVREDLAAHRVSDGFRALLRHQVARARALYASGAQGVPALGTAASRATVRVMGAVYGGILGAIEARNFDVFSARARVGAWGKVRLALGALARPPAPPLLEAGGAP